MKKVVRIRADVFHHCLVPIKAVLPNLDAFDDFQTLCGHVAECDHSSSDGYISIVKAALALGLMDAHLSALLEMTADFSTALSHKYFAPQQQKVHLVGICTALFIQFIGKQVHHSTAFDHFPNLRGGSKLEAASEQVELNKATPSRSRARHSSSGPTKAHKQHLAAVLKQLTTVEKTMSELLAKHTVSFLQMLNRLLKLPQTDTSFIACLALLFEYQNSGELDAHAWCPLGPQGEVDIEDLSKRLGEHLQLSSSSSQYNVSAATSLPGSRMRAVLEDDSLSDGGSSASGNDAASEAEPSVSNAIHATDRGTDREWDSQDIVGTSRTTVLRGESDMTSRKINIVGCHEASIYILAPMKHVFVSCCTDCIVVVGACGGPIRVENCERMHIVSASLRLTIATCHDCTFNIAVNNQPLLAGDNRFIQLAPFNAQYEHLTRHLREAGVARAPNHWNSPLELARDPYQLKSPRSSPERASSDAGIKFPVALMPPDEFLPFMVPFKGGPGPLCGGASLETFQWSPDAYATGKQPASRARPDVFPFPTVYAEALQRKIVRVATMRSAVKTSFLDQNCKQEVQAVIQAYFKDWLMNSNNIRQVYDLARLEREHAKSLVSSRSRSTSEARREAKESSA